MSKNIMGSSHAPFLLAFIGNEERPRDFTISVVDIFTQGRVNNRHAVEEVGLPLTAC